MKYRMAGSEDAARIAELHVNNWRATQRGALRESYLRDEIEAERLGCWQQRLAEADPDRMVLLAEEDGQLAGFVCTLAQAEADSGTLIDNLHVAPEFRRRGLALELLRRAAQALLPLHADEGLFLWVLKGNDAARRFYDRLGARNGGHERQPMPSGDIVSCYRYTWTNPRALIDAVGRVKR